MTSVEAAVLAKVAGIATESVVRRIRRVASGRGFGKGVAVEVTSEQLYRHHQGYWPASLSGMLPAGLNQQKIDSFLRTPEFETFTNQLIAVHLLSGHSDYRQRVRESIAEKLVDFFPPTDLRHDVDQVVSFDDLVARYKRKLNAYGIKLAEHLDASCSTAASIIKDRSENQVQVHELGFREVALDILNSIDDSLRHLIRNRDNLTWTNLYNTRFYNYHSEITAPDLNVRMPINYAKLFVGPTVLETDSSTLQPFDDGSDGRPDSFRRFYKNLDRSVLLGDPGAGKSTSSTVAALEIHRESNLIPFIVVLRELIEPEFYLPEYLADLLGRRYDVKATPESIEKLLYEGGVVVVFDGLDEVINNADRLTLARKIEIVSASYPLIKILVTCRKIGYAPARLNRSFSTFSIGPFSEEQIEEYVTHWFDAQGKLRLAELDYVVQDFMLESKEMLDLTQNPLLLAFMCVLYRGARTLPEDRASLYEKCVALLLGERDKHYKVVAEHPSILNTKRALSRVAHKELKEQRYGRPEKEITEDLIEFLTGPVIHSRERAAEFIKEMLNWCRGRAWMFTDVGPDPQHRDLFTFTHASFREYFGALYFVSTNRDAQSLVDHIFPLMEQGKSEIYAQVCCTIFDDALLSGASDVMLGLIRKLDEQQPHPILNHSEWQRRFDIKDGAGSTSRKENELADKREETSRIRSVAAAYLAGIANCLPSLSADAMSTLVGLAVAQTTLGDSAAIARLLDPASKHHEPILEILADHLSRSMAAAADTRTTRRQVWFALHAPYLLANMSSFAYPIKPTAVKALNKVVNTVSPHLKKYDGKFDVDYAMLIQSGSGTHRRLCDLDASEFCSVFSFLFDEYVLPIDGLGPRSVAIWVYDSFRGKRRETTPVARAARFLKNLGEGLIRHQSSLFDIPLPSHPAYAEHDFRSISERITAYPDSCRTALLFLIAAQIELNQQLDPMLKNDVSRKDLGQWAARLRVDSIPSAWIKEESDLWCPSSQIAE
ncbi:NACHT domain-containing NTPase [Amycolatopsis sp. cg9]|uniref:NACHT domain-containing protein n=1 Tax=Amycolatopsis sp. cg9 TaxID=3238801 RepID=UPI003524EB89